MIAKMEGDCTATVSLTRDLGEDLIQLALEEPGDESGLFTMESSDADFWANLANDLLAKVAELKKKQEGKA